MLAAAEVLLEELPEETPLNLLATNSPVRVAF
jgi:hypothetical protein